jgi:hypothetical protein
VGCKSDKSPAYSLTASEAIDTAWVRTASAASWRGRRVGRRRGAGFGSLNSVSGTERLGAKAGRGARDHVAHDMSGRRWPPEPQQADSPRRWRAILATLSCWRSPRVRRLFKLWRSMMIEQQADLEGFQAIIHEKTGMTRAEIDALDRESPEWEAYSQTRRQCIEDDCSQQRKEAWEPVRDGFYELADEILEYEATSREGLVLLARAFISAYNKVYDATAPRDVERSRKRVCVPWRAVSAYRRPRGRDDVAASSCPPCAGRGGGVG